MKRSIALTTLLVALMLASSGRAATSTRWPTTQEHAFLVNCNATSHGMLAACRCELQALERRYTFRSMADLYLHDQARLRAVLLRTALSCKP